MGAFSAGNSSTPVGLNYDGSDDFKDVACAADPCFELGCEACQANSNCNYCVTGGGVGSERCLPADLPCTGVITTTVRQAPI